MAIRRHFLKWDAPVTQRVREFLLPHAPDAAPAPVLSIPAMAADIDAPSPRGLRAVSLADTLVVVPTRQAARRLSQELVRHCATRGEALLAATIVPPTFFIQSDPPDPHVASATVVLAAWTQILQRIPPGELSVLLPASTQRQDFEWALHTGALIQELRDALVDGAYCIADVVRRFGDKLEERERWEDLARLEARYLALLASLELRDPCVAQIANAGAFTPPPGITRVIVASVPDPSLLMLDALRHAAPHAAIEILIHAPPDLEDAFDEWGRPLPEIWRNREIDIPNSETQIILEADPNGQSERAVHLLHDLNSRYGRGQVAVGVPDKSVTPFLAAACEEAGIPAFDPADRRVANHPLFSLLASLADLVTNGAYEAVSNLLRHPDVLARLCESSVYTARQLLTQLDKFQNQFLPADLESITDALHRLSALSPAGAADYAALHDACAFLNLHLAALLQGPLEPALRACLKDIYAYRQLDPHVPVDGEFKAVADKIDRALREWGDARDALAEHSAAEALRLLRLRLADDSFHPVPKRADVDLEGWLELPWNNAPGLIVTGMNEGAVPDTRLSDPFLPDSLRALLGLRHDGARFARDAYLLSAMLAARHTTGTAYCITGKQSATRDPLKPSRLLFRCADTQLAARAARLFGPADIARPSVPASVSFKLNSAPQSDPPPRLPLTRLSVTAFSGYLDCPFRFYLRRMLRMETLDDSKTGLDAMDFGTLTHAVLQEMAVSGIWRGANEARLRAFMDTETDRWVSDRFGARPPATVALAAAAAKQRLGALARVQIATAAEGWEIVETERSVQTVIAGMEVSGTIDRIDRHNVTGALRLIDYKTYDSPLTPAEVHLAALRPETPDWMVAPGDKARRWKDLQLPLYVLLRQAAAATTTPVQVGYFMLPKAVADTRLVMWDDFDAALLTSAERCATEIIQRITNRIFWPPSENVKYDDFASLMPATPEASFLPPFPELVTEERL